MKIAFFKLIVCLMAVALLVGFSTELSYAGYKHDCSCCKGQCRCNDKCHSTAKSCACNYQATQVLVSVGSILPGPILTGHLSQDERFSYQYQSVDDVFHPPRA